MPFQPFPTDALPRRLWAVVGDPGVGKSTFATRLRKPTVTVDADHRWQEVMSLIAGTAYQLSDRPADNVDPQAIAAALRANMPGSDVKTIVVDSLTAILQPIITQTMLEIEAGLHQNKAAAWKNKALAMRLLQDAVTGWGTDVLWIYHLQQGRDAKAQMVTTTTVPTTELARLLRSINMKLQIEPGGNGKPHAMRIIWSRRGRSNIRIEDPSGSWEGMPEKIEEAVYGGLTKAQQDEIERSIPTRFNSMDEALAWAVAAEAFESLPHAVNAYNQIKRDHSPANAQEMWDLWIADCLRRQSENGLESEPASEPEIPPF